MPLIKLNSPIPVPLPKEVQKCAKILESFVDSTNNGLDGVIPRQVLQHARGFAIFTVFKAGFVVSARAGSGIVIARLDDGSWSAPSAIGTAGMGFGGQAGAEVTDFLIVLNSRSAVRSFMSAGSLQLGGNMSIAVGPLGRNGEASGSLNTKGKLATMYSYSKTKGLFGGVSIEGSVLVERQDANAIAYDADVTASQLLSGIIPAPYWADPLIRALDACTGLPGGRKWVAEDRDEWIASPNPYSPGGMGGGYEFGGMGTPSPGGGSSGRRRTLSSPFGRKPSQDDDDSYFPSSPSKADPEDHDFTPVSPRPGLGRRRSLFGSKGSRNSAYFSRPLEIDGYSSPNGNGSANNSTEWGRGSPSGGKSDAYNNAWKGGSGSGSGTGSAPSRERSNSLSRFSSLSLRPKSRSSRSTPGLPMDREDEETDDFFGDDHRRSDSHDLDDWDRPYSGNTNRERADVPYKTYKPKSRASVAVVDVDEFDPYAPSKGFSPANRREPKNSIPPPQPIDSFEGQDFGQKPKYSDHPRWEDKPRSDDKPRYDEKPPFDDSFRTPDEEDGADFPKPGPIRLLSTKKELHAPDLGLGKGIALYNFEAQQAGDLGFRKGDVIVITKKTGSVDDWWTGMIGGRTGMFPANYIEVV